MFGYFSVQSQTFIEGQVFDAATKEPVGYANIYIKGTTIGTTTDDTGYYQLKLQTIYDSVSAAYLGYSEATQPIKKQERQRINFMLDPSQSMLAEAVIIGSKESLEDYLIRKILENKDKNDKKHLQNYSYESYNKIELDVKNMSEKFMNRKILKPFKFVFDNIDSTSEDEPFLPMLLSESISDFYYTSKLNKKREIIRASKISGVNDASFNEFLSATYQDIDVYDNAYTIIDKQFISPIANSCKTFYRYKVIDTLVLDNVVHYKLMFEPKTKGDNTFFGSFIVSENNYAIKGIQLRMAPHVNINFVKKIEINQDFDFVDQQFWMMTNDYLLVEFSPLEKMPAIITRKNAVYRNFKINTSFNDSVISKMKEELYIDEREVKKDQAYWDSSRFIQLSKNEAAVYHIIDTLKTVPAYKTYVDIINLVLTGYYKTGPVELGPIVSLISYNKLEGWRFGAGIRTNYKMCEWAQVGGHFAYGLRDKRFKGDVNARFLVDKQPRQIISASYTHDVSELSRTNDLLASDNILSIIINRRKPDVRLLYYDDAKLSYNIEYKQGLSMGVTLQNRKIEQGLVPFSYLYPNKEFGIDSFNTLRQTELVFNARFAIGEKYIDKNSLFRSSINTYKVPVVQFEYVYGFKRFLGSQFNYHKFTLSYAQIVPVRAIGRFEMKIQAGKILGQVPFLLTEVHDGNQTFAFSNTAFNVMNDYEFYSDQYLQWNFSHHFDGFFLNRIPGIRKLKLREVIHTRGVWGNVSAKNADFNRLNSGFIKPLGKVPYIEVGFGLENILKFIRWDVMWRVTHRDNPKAYNWMMTFGFNFNF
ncbi:MAG TPA: DUF5686 family protein [Chitinophagales bacterium]|nr:DUF5686 family protein [Chitinophagales bacterium]